MSWLKHMADAGLTTRREFVIAEDVYDVSHDEVAEVEAELKMLLRGDVADVLVFFFSSRRRHTRCSRDWSSDVCSSDLVLFGASEWRSPADPKPIRLDRSYQRVGATGARGDLGPAEAEPDLELIGTAFLEKLRPLVGQLHHRIDFPPNQPIVQIVVIGFAP